MLVRLKADVKGATGRTKHFLGTLVEGTLVKTEQRPVPAWVEISKEGGAFYLFYFGADGTCLTDTWHQTLDEAKHQAELEFAISAAEWQPVSGEEL